MRNKNITIFYSFLLVIILFAQRLLTPEYFFVLLTFLSLIIIVISKKTIIIDSSLIILLSILLLGMVPPLFRSDFEFSRDFLRDVFYVANPVIFVIFGSILASKISKNNLYTSILVFGVLLATMILINVWKQDSIFDMNYGYMAIVISLFLLFGKKNNLVLRFLVMIFLISSLIIADSRHVIIASLTILTSMLFLFLRKKKKKIMLLLLVSSLFVFAVALHLNLFGMKKFVFNAINEVQIQYSWSLNDIVMNWRGLENSFFLTDFRSYTISEKLFGQGFGHTLYVGYYSYLVGSPNGFLPVLHNGFSTLLMKGGVFSILLLLLFYYHFISLSFRGDRYTTLDSGLLLGISLALIFITFIVTGIFKSHSYFESVLVISFLAMKGSNNRRNPLL